MLSKCANPDCSEAFRYFREGKLFQIEFGQPGDAPANGQKKPAHRIEYYWLCSKCCEHLTLKFDRHKGIYMEPISILKLAAGF